MILYFRYFWRYQNNDMASEQNYSIPIRYRKMENLHIVFWLFKDISWCMVWRPLGIAMIFPTLIIAIVIAWRNKEYVSEICHNVAIVFWISANAYWMISEFLGFDAKHLFGDYTFKHLAIVPFTIGLLLLVYYYIIWRPMHKNAVETL